jgi:SAM-dependent methyltransferase
MTNSSKNKKYESFGGLGIDVAINRADDMDRFCLDEIKLQDKPAVLDLGCGAGGQSFRMVEAGALVVAVDKGSFSKRFEEYKTKNNFDSKKLKFIQGDVTNVLELSEGAFSLVLMQRTIHYLKYQDAVKLLKDLREITEKKLFISVTGIGSGIGDEYEGKEIPLAKRFCKLNEFTANIYSIHEPVCLYTKEEFVNLLETAGWKVDRCWESAFGNIKAVCI